MPSLFGTGIILKNACIRLQMTGLAGRETVKFLVLYRLTRKRSYDILMSSFRAEVAVDTLKIGYILD